jgi:hypothetical protein
MRLNSPLCRDRLGLHEAERAILEVELPDLCVPEVILSGQGSIRVV